MDEGINRKENDETNEKFEQVKSFQEISDEISKKPNMEKRQPTPQPKDFDEIDY